MPYLSPHPTTYAETHLPKSAPLPLSLPSTPSSLPHQSPSLPVSPLPSHCLRCSDFRRLVPAQLLASRFPPPTHTSKPIHPWNMKESRPKKNAFYVAAHSSFPRILVSPSSQLLSIIHLRSGNRFLHPLHPPLSSFPSLVIQSGDELETGLRARWCATRPANSPSEPLPLRTRHPPAPPPTEPHISLPLLISLPPP